MSQRSHARGEDDRRRFVADPDALAALDLKIEQLSDPDVRSVVIRHEHPEFEQALKEGRREIEGSDGPMNPASAPHSCTRSSPPSCGTTRRRRYGTPQCGYATRATSDTRSCTCSLVPSATSLGSAARRASLRSRASRGRATALPGSWERERTTRTAATRHDDARKQARRAARAARQRNRRRPS